MKSWFAVHTLPRCEEMARSNLDAQKFETFLPRCHKTRRHARKVDVVLSPLFPRYLFVALDLAADQWLSIGSTRGVAYIVRQAGCPIAVPSGIIQELRSRADKTGVVPLSSLELFKKGDRLEILEGAFLGHTGLYEKMTEDERVQILLTLLGRPVKLSMPIHAVSLVS